MGIQDRDYYRKEGPSYLDSFAIRGQITKWLIAVNVAVFVVQLFTRVRRDPFGIWSESGEITKALWLDPAAVWSGEVWRLLTCAFLHDDGAGINRSSFWTHIVFNMWMLWVFGSDVEERLGRWEFLTFYLAAAVAASVFFVVEKTWIHPGPSIALGASGAVTAVLILATFFNPRQTILLFFVLPVPIWVFAIFMVAQDSLGFLNEGRGIAFGAHLGGAAFAALYYKLEWRFDYLGKSLRGLFRARPSRPRLRVYHGEEEPRQPVSVASSSGSDINEHLEAKLDAILEKVSRVGREGLTEQEKEILLRASEIYKRRRT